MTKPEGNAKLVAPIGELNATTFLAAVTANSLPKIDVNLVRRDNPERLKAISNELTWLFLIEENLALRIGQLLRWTEDDFGCSLPVNALGDRDVDLWAENKFSVDRKIARSCTRRYKAYLRRQVDLRSATANLEFITILVEAFVDSLPAAAKKRLSNGTQPE
jgi:hypothetical protein